MHDVNDVTKSCVGKKIYSKNKINQWIWIKQSTKSSLRVSNYTLQLTFKKLQLDKLGGIK